MFTIKIVDSDAFLDMPLSTQCLYFHLNMRADDDGFIGNPKRIMRIIGASDDDLKLLVAKRFLLTFEDGVIVIKHWRMHNTLSQNRYHETQYLDEKSMLKLKENGSYTFSDGMKIDDTKLIEKSARQSDRRVLDEEKTNSGPYLGLDIDKSKSKTKKKKVYYPNDEKLNQAFLDFMEMRKRIKSPMTDRAITLAMNKLKSLSTLPFSESMDANLAIEILEQSTLNSWKGIYPINNNSRKEVAHGRRNVKEDDGICKQLAREGRITEFKGFD